MTAKIFRSTLFVAVVVLLCSLGVVLGVLYDYFDGVQRRQLTDELHLAASGTELSGLSYLKASGNNRFRLTWVDADGRVIYDSESDEAAMENHSARREIREAMETGHGTDLRYSDTLTRRTVYEAERLSDGTVLRISQDQATSAYLVLGILAPMALVALFAIALSAVLSRRMAKRITRPLNDLDLEHPLQNQTYEEIQPLLERINRQHLQIASQMEKLQWKTRELEQITGNMSEGLMLMNRDGTILSINPAARHLFSAGEDCIGKNHLAVDPSPEIRNLINEVFLNSHSALQLHRDGKDYQLTVNRIDSEGAAIGAVLLAYDITQQLSLERSRREFSANVSHELKTPLQSILGSAELLENGLVQPEDVPRFVERIRKEAQRLVELIQDIIRLSQLDEGVELPRQAVDLFAVAQETVELLLPQAQEKGIHLTLEGESTTISGVPQLIRQAFFNLCDNAIRYTPTGGRVCVRVRDRVFQVSDTGIGIPKEHQQHIFERFYRVDKSHSRQSGGTGLGLSIVKHALQYHNAKLDLQSQPGEGTTITVTFPA